MSDAESAKKLFFEALAFLDAADFPSAERKLREASKLSPRSEAVLTNLSVVLIQQNKSDEARECAEAAIAINPGSVEAWLVLADCHSRDENLAAALDAYEKVVVLQPGIAEAHNNRGLILDRLGRHADALASFASALALDPNLSDAHINRGNALHHLQRYDEALAAYDAALASTPDLTEAWLGRGNALQELKRHDEALAAYDEVLARNPGLPHAWLGRGNVFSALKRYDEVFGAYDKALALKPDLVEAWLCRGNALCDVRRFDEAQAAYDRALSISPDFAPAWYGRGNVYEDLKRHDAAVAAYDKAIELNPAFAGAWIGRGNALRPSNREQAIDAYRQALKLGGEAESIKYYLAALGAESLPAAPPDKYVANLFDAYADTFDKDLTESLRYRVPVVLTDAIKWHVSSGATLDIMDLGCGTGLVGEYIRPFKRSLVGVDLSANMLQKAEQRKIYDRLVCCDLTEFLQSQDKAFDMAIAADVFVYLGDLSPIFAGIRRALRADGLFGFSVERNTEGNFVLRETLRYAHSIGYLRELARQHQFKVETIVSHVIRRDAGADINGYLVIMRCE